MITAVDTNVLLDVFDEDPVFMPLSLTALRECEAQGRLVACEVVWAEVAASFASVNAARDAMHRVNIEFSPLDVDAALATGAAWAAYRRRGGPRTRVVADFLIGAHALSRTDRLLTRDARFHRTYFEPLPVLDPSTE